MADAICGSRRVAHGALDRFCQSVLKAAGLCDHHAAIVADSLVFANLRGVDSHGVIRLPIYARRIREGLIATDGRIDVRHTASATAVIDAANGPGQVATMHGMETAIGLAREAGVGIVTIRNSNHFGAAGYYAMRALREDMIGIALTNAEASVVPFGGREPSLGTNPLAVAVPSGNRPPIVLDMATSVVAMGHILQAKGEGRRIPEGTAVDARGHPTTDPEQVRALLPVGGPKGYGLAVIVDVLAGALSNAGFSQTVGRMYHDFGRHQGLGHFVAAIAVSRFIPVSEFKIEIDRFISELKAVSPAEGFDEVLIPGEPEWKTETRRRAEGIPLDPSLVNDLDDLAYQLGVEPLR